jgi:predicted dehydrogenase
MKKNRTRVIKDRVRLGVIGLGIMGQSHCSTLGKIPEVQLTAVCDGFADNAKKIGELYNVPSFTGHRELIKSGLCDAVLIATPHPVRPPIAIDVMKAGLHLLSEKPLAECVSAADRMLKAARTGGVSFAVMFQRRLMPAVVKALEWVRAGNLGAVWRATLIVPEYRTQAYYGSGAWRATWKGEGGGVMINQAPHMMDLFIQLGGMPCEVQGRCETRLHKIEVEDVGEALLRYPDGGTGYLYTTTNEPGAGEMIEIFGTKGKLCYRNGDLTLHRFSESVPDFTFNTKIAWSNPECISESPTFEKTDWGHHLVVQNFARHLLNGEPLTATGEEGLQSLELANAVWLSAHLGKAVKLPLNRRAYDKFLAGKRGLTPILPA